MVEELFKGSLEELFSFLREKHPEMIIGGREIGRLVLSLPPHLTTGCPACTFDADIMGVFVRDVQRIVSKFGALTILVLFRPEAKTPVSITDEMLNLDWNSAASIAGISNACDMLPVLNGLTWQFG